MSEINSTLEKEKAWVVFREDIKFPQYQILSREERLTFYQAQARSLSWTAEDGEDWALIEAAEQFLNRN